MLSWYNFFFPTDGKIGSPVSIQGFAVAIIEMARKSMTQTGVDLEIFVTSSTLELKYV